MSAELGRNPSKRDLKITREIINGYSTPTEGSDLGYDIEAQGEAFFLVDEAARRIVQDRRYSSRKLRTAINTFSSLLTDAGRSVDTNPIVVDMQQQLAFARIREQSSLIHRLRRAFTHPATPTPVFIRDIPKQPVAITRRAFLQSFATVVAGTVATTATVKISEPASQPLKDILDDIDQQVRQVYPNRNEDNYKQYDNLSTQVTRQNALRALPSFSVALLSGMAVYAIPLAALLNLARIWDKTESDKKLAPQSSPKLSTS
ncbi:hypothetical protein A3I48_00445 [Candidatus Daviesbacteria bacterium RIFCSPLOWO2_02_FULL_36_7]|uniref:Uncharacterized protein n=1 Tax=Candidatus Daviesbacteria bacterium RIFCSPLOWO2_02_FULL_36_7 TaxID=1797792 RepID=A0A1F5MGD7_9BACT|nr:MAG: hypothetical protein A3I48_00445 [Candidatus Daviesbacteria bacterium RIFCSPLOWO2_02_FULL_36_7]